MSVSVSIAMITVGASPVVSAALWAAALIALSALAIAALYWVKRWALSGLERSVTTLTLADLRDMAARGEITQDEYERAKEAAIRAAKKSDAPVDHGGDHSKS